MHPAKKATWQRTTALVSLSTCGAMTGFSFAHGTVDDMTSPTGIPPHLLALDKPAAPASSNAASAAPEGSALRPAIVSVARYYLQLARTRTPAEMEALIWQVDSIDGADHGQSCAAFASLTLALGARAVGQQSWVTGGSSYPWPLHPWADVRVQPNPASPNVVSMLQDAQAHHRWHPLGDGYRPQPGDWVLFDGHVEVVTRYTGTALSTIGGDSLPGLTVNAHKFPAPFAAQGVLGFVDNGEPAGPAAHAAGDSSQARDNMAQVPGTASQQVSVGAQQGRGSAAIPGARLLVDTPAGSSAGRPAPGYGRHEPPPPAGAPGAPAQQAFISMVAPGAIAAQHRYGIPASVTIAQAIDESGWGQSELATADHNLFGIKGTGPAGRDMQPTQEYQNGAWVTRTAAFRVYHNVAESIEDHSRLLATAPAYRHAMADRHMPDAFAAALTGVYATDPDYGSKLIALMQLYNLYRYDSATTAAAPQAAPAGPQPAGPQPAGPQPAGPQPAGPQPAGPLAAVPGIPARGTPDGRPSAAGEGTVTIPGVAGALAAGAARTGAAASGRKGSGSRPTPRITPRGSRPGTRRYVPQIPYAVSADFVATAKSPLSRARPLYQDVADTTGTPWELLAACDWMQCQAQPRFSPVYGEKLGTVNPDGTIFRTRSAALAQCASDLVELAGAIYLIDLTARRARSVRELANVFAAFRWGGLLKAHRISAMEFPYSVAGLTAQHLKMRWPDIDEPHAPDRPGARFRRPFGAVPVVLSLGYRAVAE
jgi:Mannosyl-glycoprotein endo-beta-N-acetylglucosaminidase